MQILIEVLKLRQSLDAIPDENSSQINELAALRKAIFLSFLLRIE